jgi:hypothetical protein
MAAYQWRQHQAAKSESRTKASRISARLRAAPRRIANSIAAARRVSRSHQQNGSINGVAESETMASINVAAAAARQNAQRRRQQHQHVAAGAWRKQRMAAKI